MKRTSILHRSIISERKRRWLMQARRVVPIQLWELLALECPYFLDTHFFIIIPIHIYPREGYTILMRTREGDKLNIRGRACQKDDAEYFKQMHLSHILGSVLSSPGLLSLPFLSRVWWEKGKRLLFFPFLREKHVIYARFCLACAVLENKIIQRDESHRIMFSCPRFRECIMYAWRTYVTTETRLEFAMLSVFVFFRSYPDFFFTFGCRNLSRSERFNAVRCLRSRRFE